VPTRDSCTAAYCISIRLPRRREQATTAAHRGRFQIPNQWLGNSSRTTFLKPVDCEMPWRAELIDIGEQDSNCYRTTVSG
jgi:hypothetical protein